MASQGPADTGMFLGGSSGGDMTLSPRRTVGTNVICEDSVYKGLLGISTTALGGPGYQVPGPSLPHGPCLSHGPYSSSLHPWEPLIR